jgi:hypothetical protein
VSYPDAGYIAKFYVDEPDSALIRGLAESLGEGSRRSTPATGT